MSAQPVPAAANDDPFIEKFFGRIPRSVAESFTPDQLSAIKLAFGARSWGSHTVDLRLSMPAPGARWYLVFLLGRERRGPDRRLSDRLLHPFARLGNLAVSVLFVLLLMLPLFLALYVVKSALGIKLIPGGGAHATMHSLMDQLQQLFR
jgi:hypothetical protein